MHPNMGQCLHRSGVFYLAAIPAFTRSEVPYTCRLSRLLQQEEEAWEQESVSLDEQALSILASVVALYKDQGHTLSATVLAEASCTAFARLAPTHESLQLLAETASSLFDGLALPEQNMVRPSQHISHTPLVCVWGWLQDQARSISLIPLPETGSVLSMHDVSLVQVLEKRGTVDALESLVLMFTEELGVYSIRTGSKANKLWAEGKLLPLLQSPATAVS